MAVKMKQRKGRKLLTEIQAHFPKVQTLIDARTPVEFKVTDQDCKKGNPKQPQSCPGALALQRHVQADAALVRLSTTILIKGTKATRYLNSANLRDSVVHEDLSRHFLPGVYSLRPPSSHKLGPAHRPATGIGPRKRRTMYFTAGVRHTWFDGGK